MAGTGQVQGREQQQRTEALGRRGTAPKGHVTGRGSQTTAGHCVPSSSPCTRVNGKTRFQVPS